MQFNRVQIMGCYEELYYKRCVMNAEKFAQKNVSRSLD